PRARAALAPPDDGGRRPRRRGRPRGPPGRRVAHEPRARGPRRRPGRAPRGRRGAPRGQGGAQGRQAHNLTGPGHHGPGGAVLGSLGVMTTPSTRTTWTAPTAAAPLDATVVVPGSKSLTNRYLVLAAVADGTSRLRGALDSRDTRLMAEAIDALGGHVETGEDGTWTVRPISTDDPATEAVTVECGLAGTVMRFLPPVAALLRRPVRFDGDEQARARPMGPVLTALRELGARVDDDGRGTLPFTVTAPAGLRGGHVDVDASASSQFVSGLLLSGARWPDGLIVRHTGPTLPSVPHITMTV